MSAFNAKTLSLCIFLFLFSSLVTYTARSSFSGGNRPHLYPGQIDLGDAKVAFATFLAGNSSGGQNSNKRSSTSEEDGHFLSARVLAYQLLHSETAGTNSSIPFLVLSTKDVSKQKRDRLRKDGATVILVDNIDWPSHRDSDQLNGLAKLRLFQLTLYDKICFIDTDTLVTESLNGVFIDEATFTQPTLRRPEQVKADEGAQPRTYMFASHGEYSNYDHVFPPEPNLPRFSSDFFVFTPSTMLFDYYTSLLSLQDRFEPADPVANLLNYAHRRDGNMPWRPLWYGWNVNWPTVKEKKAGAHSFHDKFWDDDDPKQDITLRAIWKEQRAEMEGFHRGRELAGH